MAEVVGKPEVEVEVQAVAKVEVEVQVTDGVKS